MMLHQRGYSQSGWARVLDDYCLSPLQSEERGQDLLRQWLSSEQAEQYDKYQRFEVVGCDTGTRYRILRGKIMNIVELAADGRVRRRWCFAPEGTLATGDMTSCWPKRLRWKRSSWTLWLLPITTAGRALGFRAGPFWT
jgi:hypothetical protein